MCGYNNVCITQNANVFYLADANFKCRVIADIVPEDDLINSQLDYQYGSMNCVANMKEDADFLSYIEMISGIIEEALGIQASCKVVFEWKNKNQSVRFPLCSFIPLYVLRFLVYKRFSTKFRNEQLFDICS